MMRTCKSCGIAGTTVQSIPGNGDWHPGCWRQYKRKINTKLADGRIFGNRKAKKRIGINRVAHGYVIVDRLTDLKLSFHKSKSVAVRHLRHQKEQLMRGWT